MTNFTVSITSDTVCPWCYVGARKLEAGILAYKTAHALSGDTFTISWSPFLLNPEAPAKGVPKLEHYEGRFGPERTKAMLTRLSAEGAKVGIDFDYGGKTGATRDSHRVIAMAKSDGGHELQNAVVRQLFRSYFEERGDITDRNVLADAAAKAGMDRVRVLKGLEQGTAADEVDREVAEARRSLVTGVPYFVINGKYEIQGAQDPDGFRRIFEKIKQVEA